MAIKQSAANDEEYIERLKEFIYKYEPYSYKENDKEYAFLLTKIFESVKILGFLSITLIGHCSNSSHFLRNDRS